jgi:hypothetical protein
MKLSQIRKLYSVSSKQVKASTVGWIETWLIFYNQAIIIFSQNLTVWHIQNN